MRVIERLVRYSLLIYFVVVSQTFTQTYPDPIIDSLWKDINSSLILQEYDSAGNTARRLTSAYPDLPLGIMLKAAVEITKAYDLGLEYNLESIDSLLNNAFSLSEVLLEADDGNAWANYFAGASLGLKAYFNAINSDFLNAFGDGYSALQYFDKCLLIDTTFHEAKISIGTYLYWKSEKTSELSWLPFFNDDKQNGIRLLEEASDSAVYNKFFAQYSLMWILIHEKNTDAASRLAGSFLDLYPGSRLFKYAAGKAIKESSPADAIKYYQELLDDYISMEDNNHLNEIIYRHKIAQLYYTLEDHVKVVEYCDSIFSIKKISPFVRSALNNRLERAENLRNEALRLSSKN